MSLPVIISSTRIAYVDIEQVYEELDEIEHYREEIKSLLYSKKEEIEGKEKEILELKKLIEEEMEELSSEEIEEYEYKISGLEEELEKDRVETKRMILFREEELKYEIYGKIYDAVEKIAQNEGYNVILKKDTVLYSEDSVEDITEKIIEKINLAVE